jgi:hypothetical protein
MMRSIPLVVALVLMAGCDATEQADLGPDALMAEVGLAVTQFPSAQDPGFPYYARTEPQIFHDGGWAAVIFYRGPTGIPADFNLLQFFHFPGPGPGAFAVPLNVSGQHHWTGEPFAAPPMISRSSGMGAVPILFVPAATLLGFIDQQGEQPVLTIAELLAMDGAVLGHASQFQEVLHPHPDPSGNGGHIVPKLNVNARGTLAGGGTFQLNINGRDAKTTTRIRFN